MRLGCDLRKRENFRKIRFTGIWQAWKPELMLARREICGLTPVPEVVPARDIARSPWLRKCGSDRNVFGSG
jgi:hypothetical protein